MQLVATNMPCIGVALVDISCPLCPVVGCPASTGWSCCSTPPLVHRPPPCSCRPCPCCCCPVAGGPLRPASPWWLPRLLLLRCLARLLSCAAPLSPLCLACLRSAVLLLCRRSCCPPLLLCVSAVFVAPPLSSVLSPLLPCRPPAAAHERPLPVS